MKSILFLLCLLVSSLSLANTLPELPSNVIKSNHRFFLSSQSPSDERFDIWRVDGGYSYNAFKNIDLYVGARVNNSTIGSENGFLSGVSYKLSDKVSLKSTLHTYIDDRSKKENSALSAEVSSRMKLTDHLDIHATLDYEEWQQGIELGLGFRF